MAPGELSSALDGQVLTVTVSFSPVAGQVDEAVVQLQRGATVAEAIAASGLAARHPESDLASLSTGVWGALCEQDQLLRDRDRVELYRPLAVDPKEARRLRYKASGSEARAKGKAKAAAAATANATATATAKLIANHRAP